MARQAYRKVWALIGVLAVYSPAFAFNESGFRSGMSYAEANAIVAQRGQTLKDVTSTESNRFKALLIMNPSRSGPEAEGSLSFCDGKLTFYSYLTPGGIHTFVRLLAAKSSSLGGGAVTTSSSVGREGAFDAAEVTWSFRDEAVKVSIGQLDNGTIQVTQTYTAPPRTCLEK